MLVDVKIDICGMKGLYILRLGWGHFLMEQLKQSW